MLHRNMIRSLLITLIFVNPPSHSAQQPCCTTTTQTLKAWCCQPPKTMRQRPVSGLAPPYADCAENQVKSKALRLTECVP